MAGFRVGGSGAIAVMGLLLLAGATRAEHTAPAPETPAAFDGIVDGLLAGRDPTLAPPGVNEATWATLVPADNSLSPARVALGRRLYFETALSRDGTVSCASCHDPAQGFADGRAVSVGVGGKKGERNAPSTLNAALLQSQFWDGRAATLEEQAAGPILNPVEMAMPSPAAAVTALKKKGYGPAFFEAYGRPLAFADITRAIAAFERTLVFLRAPFDRYMAGDSEAISVKAQAGWRLFRGRGKCLDCHTLRASAPLGTDNRFHNIGVSARQPGFVELAARALAASSDPAMPSRWQQLAEAEDLSPLGRFLVTRDPADLGAFRSPPLRNVALTAPYMHDGSMKTLWDVMDYYNNGGVLHAHLDKNLQPLDLDGDEIDQLVEFLFTLTDDRLAGQNQGALERQRAIATKSRPIRDETGPLLRVPSSREQAAHGLRLR